MDSVFKLGQMAHAMKGSGLITRPTVGECSITLTETFLMEIGPVIKQMDKAPITT